MEPNFENEDHCCKQNCAIILSSVAVIPFFFINLAVKIKY